MLTVSLTKAKLDELTNGLELCPRCGDGKVRLTIEDQPVPHLKCHRRGTPCTYQEILSIGWGSTIPARLAEILKISADGFQINDEAVAHALTGLLPSSPDDGQIVCPCHEAHDVPINVSQDCVLVCEAGCHQASILAALGIDLTDEVASTAMLDSGREDASGEGDFNDDIENADLFARQHVSRLRFAAERDEWLHWTGTHMATDFGGHMAIRFAKQTARSLNRMAQLEESPAKADALRKRAKYAGDEPKLRKMVNLAKEILLVHESELDQHPWLFNVANGVLDLKTGELLPHDPSLLLTKVSPVEFQPGATYKPWSDFLRQTIPNDVVRSYVQAVIGGLLVGKILNRQGSLIDIHGPAGTGKGTFIDAIGAVLGPYHEEAGAGLFVQQKYGRNANDATPILAKLAGARLVTSSELPKGATLDARLVKQISGSDKITARHLNKGAFSYVAQFSIVFVGNNRFHIGSDPGGALRQRMVELIFDQQVPKDVQDESFKDDLKNPSTAGPAVLAWLVSGCLAAQQPGGLNPPKQVEEATDAYFAEEAASDPLTSFILEHWSVDSPSLPEGERARFPSKGVADRARSAGLIGANRDHTSVTAFNRALAALSNERSWGLVRKPFGNGGVDHWFGLRPAVIAVEPQPTWGEALANVKPFRGSRPEGQEDSFSFTLQLVDRADEEDAS